jgi:hypothetical protein
MQQVEEWTEHVHDIGKDLLSNTVDSWMTGVNKNLAGKQKRTIARYSGSSVDYRARCDAVTSANYDTFTLA